MPDSSQPLLDTIRVWLFYVEPMNLFFQMQYHACSLMVQLQWKCSVLHDRAGSSE